MRFNINDHIKTKNNLLKKINLLSKTCGSRIVSKFLSEKNKKNKLFSIILNLVLHILFWILIYVSSEFIPILILVYFHFLIYVSDFGHITFEIVSTSSEELLIKEIRKEFFGFASYYSTQTFDAQLSAYDTKSYEIFEFVKKNCDQFDFPSKITSIEWLHKFYFLRSKAKIELIQNKEYTLKNYIYNFLMNSIRIENQDTPTLSEETVYVPVFDTIEGFTKEIFEDYFLQTIQETYEYTLNDFHIYILLRNMSHHDFDEQLVSQYNKKFRQNKKNTYGLRFRIYDYVKQISDFHYSNVMIFREINKLSILQLLNIYFIETLKIGYKFILEDKYIFEQFQQFDFKNIKIYLDIEDYMQNYKAIVLKQKIKKIREHNLFNQSTICSQVNFIKPRKVNWDEIRKKSIDIGMQGELIVLEFEKERLISLGLPDLAKRIRHTSDIDGDGYGYDILSFSENSKLIFIEVKSTSGASSQPMFFSNSELKYLEQNKKSTYIYRVSNLNGINDVNIDIYNYQSFYSTFELEAKDYRITMQIKNE